MKARIKRVLVRGRNTLHPKYVYQNMHDERAYRKSLAQFRGYERKHDLAVVVHLYYPESWPLILQKLKKSLGDTFDLFITMPAHNAAFAEMVRTDMPKAVIVVLPNRGRDVLPFLRVAEQLYRLEYVQLLKLHTKKSTHRTDGADWFNELLSNLLPEGKKVVSQLFKTLDDTKTGIIGPAGQYMSLTVNFEANGMHMTRLLNRMYDHGTTYRTLQAERAGHGFFAGTMFWARMDALAPLLKANIPIRQFETEKGQIDATLAHAMERVLGLLPEIDHRAMYEIDPKGLKQISYDAGIVPDWSAVYIGPTDAKKA